MDDHNEFIAERRRHITSSRGNKPLRRSADTFLEETVKSRYSYNFDWLGLPVIQYPQDLVALQEIIWTTKPDCIIETGIARGGSLVFYASMLEMLGGDRFVVGIDIDIRAHNRQRILAHPLSRSIRLVDGSSVESATVEFVRKLSHDRRRIMVCLDSNHTEAHVLAELEMYAPMVTPECYCVVFDTIVEQMPKGFYDDRPWDKGNNPKTAIASYLRKIRDKGGVGADGKALAFEVDEAIDDHLLISAARGGFLRRQEVCSNQEPRRRDV